MTDNVLEQTESYCLNLHARYAPTWGVWEVARELYANAKDAAPETMKIDSPNANTLILHTDTVPDIGQLFIIGCGSKGPGGDTIGQFGEGLKLAALVATRTVGASLVLRLPRQTVTFEIRKHLGQDVLFAVTTPSEPRDGYTCELRMSGAGYILNGRIIDGDKSRMIEKPEGMSPNIYCKGVWICTLIEDDAIWSYNLNDIKLNRDRSMADMESITSSVGGVLKDSMSDELADRLIASPNSWESNKCLYQVVYMLPATAYRMIGDAFSRRHGAKGVLGTSIQTMGKAREYGFEPHLLGDGLAAAIRMCGIVKTDVDIIPKHDDLVPVETFVDAWKPMLDELVRLAEIIGAPHFNIRVFVDSDALRCGCASGNTIWLSERMMLDSNRYERIRTFLHELAHVQTGADDATRAFENGLDMIAGRLAVKLLDKDSTNA